MSRLNQTREQHFRGHHRIRLGRAVPAIRAHKSRLHSDGHTEGQEEAYQSRGFAFVSFVDQEYALSAMAELQGHRYDCMILKLEWERPRAQKCEWSTTCGEGERFMPLSKNNIVTVFFVTSRCHPLLSPLTRRPPEGQHVWNDE